MDDENAQAARLGGDGGLADDDQLGEQIETLDIWAPSDSLTAAMAEAVTRSGAAGILQYLFLRQIKADGRFRKEMGDIQSLMDSIADVGLLHPPVVTTDNVLIAGARRCEAWRRLKGEREQIPVRVVALRDVVRGEAAENFIRKDFTLSEAVAIKRAIEPEIKAAAKDRIVAGGQLKSAAPAKLAEAAGTTRDKVAAFTGVKRSTLAKAEAIIEAAEAEPDKFGNLVEDMDRTGRVNGPFKRLQNTKATEAIRKEPPPLPKNGPYRAGIIDAPWASEPDDVEKDHGARGYYPYPTMTPQQVAKMPVRDILHANASVWMWITNHHLMHGHHLMIAESWGLKPVALLTWVKDRMGQGQRVRGATEHVLQLVRGDVACLGSGTKTWFEGKAGVHSQKPTEFYDIVEKLTPAPRYFEMFSRGQARECWDLHGNDIGKLETTRSPPKRQSLDVCASIQEIEIPAFLQRNADGSLRYPDAVP